MYHAGSAAMVSSGAGVLAYTGGGFTAGLTVLAGLSLALGSLLVFRNRMIRSAETH